MTYLPLPKGNAICYSGYRDGQNPGEKTYPTLTEIREDLAILRKHPSILHDVTLNVDVLINSLGT